MNFIPARLNLAGSDYRQSKDGSGDADAKLEWLTAGRHAFHPVYEVCGISGITRRDDNGQAEVCGQSGFERFSIAPDDDEWDSKSD